MSPGLPCVGGTIHIQGPVQQNGGPARVELKEIPQISLVQPNDGGELQCRTIMSWLQPTKPSRIASTLSIPQPYRKHGRTNDPLELQRMLPAFPDFGYAQLRTEVSKQLGTLLYA